MAGLTLTTAMLRGGARALANPYVQGFLAAAATKGIGSGMRVYAEWDRHAPPDEIARTARREGLLMLQSAVYSSLLSSVFQRRLWPGIIRSFPKAAGYHELAYAALIGTSIFLAELVSREIAPPRDYRDEEREILARYLNGVQARRAPSVQEHPGPRDRREARVDSPQPEMPLRFSDQLPRRRVSQEVPPGCTPPSVPVQSPNGKFFAGACVKAGTFSL